MNQIPLFDAHCDTISAIALYGGGPLRENALHVDLLRAGAYRPYAQFFALWAPPDLIAREGYQKVFRRQYRVFRREMKKNADLIAPCRAMTEARSLAAEGKGAAFLSVEGAELLGCSPEGLQEAYRLGVRAVNLTWNRANLLSGAHDHDPERGLSALGRSFVREMQRLGMLVDVSHLSERGFWDVLALAEKPVMASHSNAKALKNHSRNLTDRQFTAIIENRGVAGLNLYAGFLGENPTVETALDHIEHFLDLGGAKHLCLGFDLDGCDTLPAGFRGIGDAYLVYDGLLRAEFWRSGCAGYFLSQLGEGSGIGMQYVSTRNKNIKISAQEAIIRGLAPDGGLYLPEALPSLARNALENLKDMPYGQRAVYLMSSFLSDFKVTEMTRFAEAAYGPDRFDTKEVAPVRAMENGVYALELWHGPTCAFKDLALQMLPWLLRASMQKQSEDRTVCILVATSGDTGKAALEGFHDVKGTKILVFYPKDGVSAVQELQMVTQTGENVGVCAVEGNFDDAQNGVKRIFSDEAFRKTLEERGLLLSSANSINWGRVLPQLVYYISAYCDMLKSGAIESGEKINICVPTGNFGNILAAFYAREMGLPVKKLICASNQNNVLTDFLRTGVYDRNRTFHATISPSMDILISSNLERLLYTLSCRDDEAVCTYMDQLASGGRYAVSGEIRDKLQNIFWGGYCGDKRTKEVIAETWREQNYLVDTHTAVGLDVLAQYRAETGDMTPALVASTASPFKFCDSVLEALGEPSLPGSIENIDRLSALTGVPAPLPLSGLRDRRVRFSQSVARDKMEDAVLEILSGAC